MPRPTERDQLMSRYALTPMGNGCYSVYDKRRSEFIAHYSGRGAYNKALKHWHTLIKSGRPGYDANAT